VEADQPENRGLQILQELAVRAQDDEELWKRLQAEPHTVLREAGLEVPGDVRVEVHRNTDDVLHLVLPSEPQAVLDPDDVNLRWVINGTHF
jgi:hypothetical protein